MARAFVPTVTNFPDGIVIIKSVDGTSYKEIQASLGSTVYQLEKFYLKTQTKEQLQQPFFFEKYDVNGNKQAFAEIIIIDPNQIQNSIEVEMQKHGVIFDGQTTPSVKILPNQTLSVYFYVNASSGKIDYLPKEDMFTESDFFANFNDELDF
jgi:hypothetical protein